MKLLLAEDERALSDALVVILKHNGYSVDAVCNGEEALEYLACGEYDGVILDIMMPRVDGIEVLRRIRAAGNAVPVLMLTAKSDIDDRVKGLDCGADDYLTKPFATRELLARLRAITRRSGGRAENILKVGDLTLDCSQFALCCAGGKLPLTAKEFGIMELLMRSPGRVISAERIMDSIWGSDSDAEISVVWTYLSYLRKKLKLLGSRASIRVVRNIGYTLDCGTDGGEAENV